MRGPCLSCGKACNAAVYAGAVGPFCSDACRDKQQDAALWKRANDYAARVVDMLKTLSPASYSTPTHAPIETSDVARAFVIGFAAGFEEGQSPRRTVRK